jgi:hypothetical protein
MEVSGFSVEPPPSASFFSASFLCSEECCDTPFDVIENLESSDVFPVDSTRGAVDDLLVLERLVDGEPLGAIIESGTPLSSESSFGRLLNWVRCTTVGFGLSRAIESFRAVPEDIGGMGVIELRPFGVWLLDNDSTTEDPEAETLHSLSD